MAKKIFIIDGNDLMIEVMTYILKSNGYEVISYHDGNNIFNDIKINHPDLIIIDSFLSGLNGKEICTLIKLNRDTKRLPVIICSDIEDIDYLPTQKGAPNDVLHKPFNIASLIEKVEFQLVA